MKVGDLAGYLKQRWPAIREQLLNGTYQPQPVKRVEITKPDGGVRKLGIPTVLDRFIQQAVMQVLQSRWDGTFSEHSHGFRPQRTAHQAVAKAQQYIACGHGGEGAAGERQEDAQADSSISGVGRDGERAGESGGGGYSARRATVSTAVESRARRTRPRVRARPTPFCALRG